MPALSKRTPKQRPKARMKPLTKSSLRTAEPSLRFYHSKALRAKTLAVLSSVEHAKDLQHRDELSDLVVELTNSGMDYYFLRPLRLAKAGFVSAVSQSWHGSYNAGISLRHLQHHRPHGQTPTPHSVQLYSGPHGMTIVQA